MQIEYFRKNNFAIFNYSLTCIALRKKTLKAFKPHKDLNQATDLVICLAIFIKVILPVVFHQTLNIY